MYNPSSQTTTNINNLIEKGNFLEQAGKLDEAIACYRQVIELDSNNYQAYQKLAEIAQKQGNWEQAGNYYRKIIELQAKIASETAQTKLQTLVTQSEKLSSPIQVTKITNEQELVRQAESSYEQKKWQETITLCQKIIEINPNLAEICKLWGNSLQQIGQNEEALKLYNQALEINPNFAEVYANMGSMYARKKDWQEALNYYQKAVNLNPKLAPVYRNIAKIFKENGQNEQSIQATYQASLIEPEKTTPEEYYQIANFLLKQEQTDKAISCLHRAIEYNSDFLPAYQQLAEILQKQGDLEQAGNYYRKIVELQAKLATKKIEKSEKTLQSETDSATLKQTNSAEGLANLGSMYAQKRQWEEAISAYEKALEINPQLTTVYQNLALVYEQIEQPENAARYWRQVYKLEPQIVKPENFYNLGSIFLKQKKLTEAFNCYRSAIQIQSDFSPAYHKLGLILIQQNKLTEAKQCFQQAIKQNAKDAQSHVCLSEIYLKENLEQEATNCCLQAIKIDPNNWQAYHNLGNIYLKQEENWKKAADCLRQAIKINPNFSWSHHNLGEACLNLKCYQEAAKEFQKAVELNPNFHWSYYNLGEALLNLKKWEKAVHAYKEASKLETGLPEIEFKINQALQGQSQATLEEAFNVYLEEIKENPDDLDLYYKALAIQPENKELINRLNFLKKQNSQGNTEAEILILFCPDYTKTNPYQVNLYSSIPNNYHVNSGTIDEAIQLAKTYGDTKKIIFHLHWINFVISSAKNQEEAEDFKQKFIEKLYLFLSLNGLVVWTIHNNLHHDSAYPEVEIALRKELTYIASKIHIHSEQSIPEIEQFFPLPHDKIQILHHGHYIDNYPNYITTEQARARFGYGPEELVFLFLGQLRPYKGMEDLIEAFVDIHKLLPNSHLLIAGNPVYPFKKGELKNKTRVFSNIKVIEEVIPDSELQWFFKAANVVVLPYRNILTSGSVINALSFARPVIAPKVGMIRELVKDGYNGLTYEIENVKSLSQALLNMATIINQTEDKETLYSQCLHSVEHLSWNNHAQLLFGDLEPLIKQEQITIETETVVCQIYHPSFKSLLNNDSPKVGIIILNYNSTEDTQALVKSLSRSSYQNYQIIIVDNNSDNISFEKLISLLSNYTLIRSPKNLGYAGGNNLAIQYVKNYGFDYIWILNPDTLVKNNTLEELVSATKKYPDISIYGSVIYWTDRPDIVWFGGAKVNITETQFHTYHLYNGEHKSLIPQDVYEVDYVTGASLFCPVQLFDEVGLIPERYFLYFEETDWCLKAKEKGYQIAIIPSSQLYHSKKSQTGTLPTKYYFYYYIRGSVLFMLKYFSQDLGLIKKNIEQKFITPWLNKINQQYPQQFFYFQTLAEKALEHGFAGVTGKVNLLEIFNPNQELGDVITTSVEGSLINIDRKKIKGWVWNKNQPLETLDVTIKIDGINYQIVRADQELGKLKIKVQLMGYYGFEIPTPSILFDSKTHTVEAWVDNMKLSSAVSETITFEELPPSYKGRIDGIYHRQIQGWALDENNPNKILTIEILHEKEVILSAECNRERTDLQKAGYNTSSGGFLVDLPLRYCDGRTYNLALRVLGGEPTIYSRSLAMDVTLHPRLSVKSIDEMFSWLYHYREISMIHSDNRQSIYLKQIETWGDQFAYRYKNRKQNQLVSIIVPAYNRGKTIAKAIASVKEQTYTNWELIIVDDGSDDDTLSVVQNIINENENLNIVLIQAQENGGVSRARNLGLAKAQGEIIAYLDSDNSWDPNFLLVMVNMLKDNPWARSAYCGDRIWQYYAENTYIAEEPEITAIRFGHFNKSLIENRNYIDLNVFVHHRELYDLLGGFREDMRRLVDWELIVRYTHFAPPKFVPAILANYNMGLCENQITKVENWGYNSLKMIETLEQLHKINPHLSDDGSQPGGEVQAEVIINACEADLESLEICLQSLIANTNLDQVKIIIYLNEDSVFPPDNLTLIQDKTNCEFRQGAFHKTSEIMADAAQHLSEKTDCVLLSYQAIVSQGWLEALRYPTQTRDDVAIVVGREIRNKHDNWANRLVPYAGKLFDIDVMLNPENNIVVNPGFDESSCLVELSELKLFCVYFASEIFSNINFSAFLEWDENTWPSAISSLIKNLEQRSKIAYTPKSLVFHNSYFA